MMPQRNEEPSLGELFASLARDTSTLVRQEVELARTEITRKATSAGKEMGYIAAGGAIAYLGLIVLAFAIVWLLAEVLPLWLSALIVGLVVAAIGYFVLQKGLSDLKRLNLAPKQTIETLKEDVAWAKDQIK
jgi:predicted membrane-bound spermidine synthase